MASEKHVPCGPCMFDDVTKNAGKWCTNCEEGLCEDCGNSHRKSKILRNHKVISIDDYRKIENISISQFCEHHGENFEWFCKSHDEVLCVVCVPSKHKACSEVIPISVALSNARQSTALSDLEDAIETTLLNVTKCIINRESATNDLEKQELTVKNMILETRTKVNLHLDKLEEKLLRELRETADSCKSKYNIFLKNLKSMEEMLNNLREQTRHMKQFSSDIQVFLGTRQINRRINNEIESIKSEICATKDYEFKVSMHSIITDLSNNVEEFGQIKVSEFDAKLYFTDPKIDQAQIGINDKTSRNISNIKLHPIKTFQMQNMKEMNITGCIILPNGNLCMACNTSANILIEYSGAGQHIRNIPVYSKPYDIAVIDLSRIVVTYGDAAILEIMNNSTFKVEKIIRLQNSCMGVSHENGRLYVVSGYDTVHVLDLSGTQLKILKIASNTVLHITTSKDKIYYTDYKSNKVHCCSLNGEELWQLHCDCLRIPTCVTVDNYNNAYVVDYISNNLIIIQHDGKENKTLLTKSDGLYCSNAIFYDKHTRTLLICNEKGFVMMYKLV
ncbi:uncharacterized protein [Mytilus edulis]|uniref:uncharacterized protein n=1 Tax=Mytilus edulis TaxID=6550 RepID=UPI0039EFA6DB